MTLIISNPEVESLFTMADCIEVLEDGYRELALGQAVNSPRTDMLFPTRDPGTFYKFKCIQGGIVKLGVVGQRNQSDHQAALGVDRRSQKSSKRPLSLQQRRAMIASAPATVQCIPARLQRVPMATLQPASTTPVEVHSPLARNSA